MKISDVAELLSVSPDTIRRWADQNVISASRSKGGHREIDPVSLADFLKNQSKARQFGLPISARNNFRGLVTDVKKDTVMAQIDIVSGKFRIVSLTSREACDELGLKPGMLAVASCKATNVVITLTEASYR